MTTVFHVGPYTNPDRIRLGPAAASGAEGVLYRAYVDEDDVSVEMAVKMLQPGHLDQLVEWTARWREQAELLRRVEVPGLVRVHGGFVGPLPHTEGNADPSTSSLFLVMDWVDGIALDRWARSVDNPEPEDLLLALVPVAAALDLLHSGAATGGTVVLHRDVKPANILVRPGGDTVLVDVGSVRGLVDEERRSGVVGTAGYIAPEVTYDAQYGPAADRYALGGVAYFLLTGEEPPIQAPAEELARRLKAAPLLRGRNDVAQHVLAMLDPDPQQRPVPLANWVAQLRRSSLVVLPSDLTLAPRAPGRNPTVEMTAVRPAPVPGGARRGRRVTRRQAAAAALGLVALVAVLIGVQAQRGVDGQRPRLLANEADAGTTIPGSTTTTILEETTTTAVSTTVAETTTSLAPSAAQAVTTAPPAPATPPTTRPITATAPPTTFPPVDTTPQTFPPPTTVTTRPQAQSTAPPTTRI